MLPPAAVRRSLLPLLLVATLGCGEDNPPGNMPTIGTPPTLSLSGTWTGTIGASGTGTVLQTTWTATQTGNSVTGVIALFKASANLNFSGTLTGTLSGNQVTLTYTIPSGEVPGLPDCSMSGTGTADATNTALAGFLDIVYTNCQGFIDAVATREPVTLSK